MICKDCGEKDMRYDEQERTYYCNNCTSTGVGIYEENDKTVIDSWELREKSKGFESGVLLCWDYVLRGYLCNQCRSQSKCDKNYFK